MLETPPPEADKTPAAKLNPEPIEISSTAPVLAVERPRIRAVAMVNWLAVMSPRKAALIAAAISLGMIALDLAAPASFASQM